MQTENKPLLIAIVMLSLYITIISPLNLLIGNYEEFNYGFMEMLPVTIPYFLLVFLALIFPAILINRLSNIVKKIYLSIIVAALTLSVINNQGLFGHYGAFDGRGLNIDIYSPISIIQILVAIVVACAVIFSKFRKGLLIFSSAYLILSFVFNVSLLSFHGGKLYKGPRATPQDFAHLSKNNPNYIYILLDEVYGGSTQEIFRTQADLAKEFTGFTNYTNVAGIFPTTMMAIPAILTNQIYQKNANIKAFYKKSFKASPLLKSLASHNFNYKLHTMGYYCIALPNGVCSYGPLEKGATKALTNYIRLLNLSLFKSAPDILKKYVYRDGNWLLRDLWGLMLFKVRRSHIREFDYLLKNLKVLNGPPTFRFFHTLLTHSPIKYNSQCKFLKDHLPRNFENYLGQDICGFVQVTRIIDKLKALDVYNNTYIVISSDHGRPFIPSELSHHFASAKNVTPREYGFAHATLMIKPFNAKGSLKSSHLSLSLLDISPLIINSIEDNHHNVFHTRRFYDYDWSKMHWGWREKTLAPFKGIYLIGEDIKNPSSWTKKMKLPQHTTG